MVDLKLDGPVEISNAAINMISTMPDGERDRLTDRIERVIADANGRADLRRLPDYPDVYVARGQGLRVIFRMRGGRAYVTTVARDG